MRAEVARHFNAIAVVWALALMVGFMYASLSRAEHSADEWTYTHDSRPWVVPAGH